MHLSLLTILRSLAARVARRAKWAWLLPVETAHAQGTNLGDIGAGFVTGLWVDPCSILPYCDPFAMWGVTGVEIITNIIAKTVLFFVGSGAILIILYAAARMVTSAGNDEVARNAAKKTILYALLGLLFAILASAIVNYVFGLVSYMASYI